MIDQQNRYRTVRILLIIGGLFTIGFAFIGLLINEWLFAFAGLLAGLFFCGMGLVFNHFLKKENGHVIVMKYLMPAFYITLAIQALLAIGKIYAQ